MRVTTDLCKAWSSRRRCITENEESDLNKPFFQFILPAWHLSLTMM